MKYQTNLEPGQKITDNQHVNQFLIEMQDLKEVKPSVTDNLITFDNRIYKIYIDLNYDQTLTLDFDLYSVNEPHTLKLANLYMVKKQFDSLRHKLQIDHEQLNHYGKELLTKISK